MSIFKFFTGVDMTDTAITTVADGTVTNHSDTEVDIVSGPGELDIHGKHFGDFDADGLPHSGTIQGMDLFIFGSQAAQISKLQLDVSVFEGFVAAGDDTGLINYLLKG